MTAPQPFAFSIRPKYVKRILDGDKLEEFRKSEPRVTQAHPMILIYETAPCSMIVATAYVSRLTVGTPGYVWDNTTQRGVTRAEFDAYYKGSAKAVALRLCAVRRLARPRPLPEGMSAPQSWSRYKGVWS